MGWSYSLNRWHYMNGKVHGIGPVGGGRGKGEEWKEVAGGGEGGGEQGRGKGEEEEEAENVEEHFKCNALHYNVWTSSHSKLQ